MNAFIKFQKKGDLTHFIENIVSGLIGGLPITQVIVRSSANINSGGRSKLSAIVHGFLLLISVMLIPSLLNNIPLAVLAAILLIVGYKLASPQVFKEAFIKDRVYFSSFLITILGVVFTNLLLGIFLGFISFHIFGFIKDKKLKSDFEKSKKPLYKS